LQRDASIAAVRMAGMLGVPKASDSLGIVANWPARLPRGERNGARLLALSRF
jgi:hypothetical protein